MALLGLSTSCGRPKPAGEPPSPPITDVPAPWETVVTTPATPGPKAHLDALAKIGAEEGNRAAGSAGYAKSLTYVQNALPSVFTVEKQSFSYKTTKAHKAVFAVDGREAPPGAVWPATRRPFKLSFTGPIIAADEPASPYPGPKIAGAILGLGTAKTPASGCQREHFPTGKRSYALIVSKGGCSPATKAALARRAGASLVISLSTRPAGCLGHSLPASGREAKDSVPHVQVDAAWWQQVAMDAGRISADLDYRLMAVSTDNLIARLSGSSSTGQTFAVGAHLDSVAAGAGVNDNISGVAALLALADTIASQQPAMNQNLTLLFWGGEEDGLKGSRHYVSDLTAEQRSAISGYLNLDMVASPNPGRFIYGSTGRAQDALLGYYQKNGLATQRIIVGERSDHFPFQQAGIAVAGLYSGGSEIKSTAQQEVFGGTSGRSYDSCYHQSCDDSRNVAAAALAEAYRAVAHVTAIMVSTP